MAFKAGLVPSLDVLLIFVAEAFVCCNSAQSAIGSFFNKLISTVVSGVAKSCDLHHILADLAPGSPLSSGKSHPCNRGNRGLAAMLLSALSRVTQELLGLPNHKGGSET